MAIWRHTLGQSAVKAATELVNALVAAEQLGDESVEEAFARLRDENFAYLDKLASADDEAYASDKPAAKKSYGGSSSRSSKTGGRKSGGPRKGGSSTITLADAQSMELNFGAFEGVTLAGLLEIDADTADADFSYGDGERDGSDYLSWLASDRNKNEYVQRRARLVCDDAGIDYE